jgi:CubicO group peptidase (beta-lactamase class C family)
MRLSRAMSFSDAREPAGVDEGIDLGAAARLVVDTHGASPCAVVGAAVRRGDRWRYGAGAAGRLAHDPSAKEASIATIFDLASVTKPVTALTLARLARSGVLGRDELLGDVLPRLAGTRSARVPLDLLSAHRAGLEAHLELFAPLRQGLAIDPAAALVTCADARREGCEGDPPREGFPPVYSDLGYLLLGAAIAARSGVDLDRIFDREVVAPLGLDVGSARALRARGGFDDRVAPTENVAFRGGIVRGVVHDENAWALTGDAASGHAGLFGDARSVVALGVAILDALAGRRADWLSPGDLEPLLRPRPGGSHLAGFDRRSGDAPSSGRLFGPRTFGHLGFTGTSLWIDPDASLVGVLLTNRVHPTRDHLAIRRARPAAYDAIAEAMLGGC